MAVRIRHRSLDIILTPEDLTKCEKFCNEMVNFQKNNRSGGNLTRSEEMRKHDIYRGKVAEFVCKYFFKTFDKTCEIDLGVYPFGEWDDGDIKIDDMIFSIKSGKFFANWLLLEVGNRKWEKPPNYFIFVKVNRDENGGEICGFITPDDIFQEKNIQKKGDKLKGTNTILDVSNYAVHISNLNTDFDMFSFGALDILL